MLPKKRRLTRQQFWQVTQQGQSVSGPECVAKFASNGLSYSRWAVVTSTKLSKRAVVRNRLRRQIYRLLSTEHRTLNIDAIIFPRLGMLNLNDAHLAAAINQVVSKIPGMA